MQLRNKLLVVLGILFLSVSNSFGIEGKITFEVKLTGEGADQMAAFMPSHYRYWFSEKGVRMEMEGGMMSEMGMNAIIVIAEENQAYSLNHSSEEATKLPNDEETESEEDDDVVVEKTSITEKILGYTCTKYILKSTEGRSEIWATTELESIGINNSQTSALSNPLINGMILKMTTYMDMEGTELVMTQTAVELEFGPQDATLFQIPSSYKVVEGNLFEGK